MLSSVFPNPLRSGATVVLDLPQPQAVSMEVYNLLGQRVGIAHEGVVGAGTSEMPLDTSSLAPGVYVVRVKGEGFSEAQRITVVR